MDASTTGWGATLLGEGELCRYTFGVWLDTTNLYHSTELESYARVKAFKISIFPYKFVIQSDYKGLKGFLK